MDCTNTPHTLCNESASHATNPQTLRNTLKILALIRCITSENARRPRRQAPTITPVSFLPNALTCAACCAAWKSRPDLLAACGKKLGICTTGRQEHVGGEGGARPKIRLGRPR